ncbi:MAG: hypothetical protein E6J41_02395 [Chloroflexi bacterium]|nr:MAG: hypothetical protein E6J41_02395 [Chloroflexota bacterium]
MGGRFRPGVLALAVALVACAPAGSSSPPPELASPTARLGAVFVADPAHHDLLLFGGRSRSGVLADTWLWTGGRWQRQDPGAAPPGRSFAGAAADHGGVLLFGGDPSDPTGTHDDTWRWDGTRWTRLHPRTVPDDGAFRTMATGPDGAPVLVVFAADRTVHTWTWRGDDWVEAPAGTASPPWLDDAAPVLDRTSGQLLLAGGIPPPGARPDGTWAWDGTAWTELRTAHQPAGGPAAAADLAGGPLLLEQDGTWTWGAGDWRLAQPPGEPRWMAYSALAAVPGAGPGQVQAVLLTGAAGDRGQTWRWNGYGWTQT